MNTYVCEESSDLGRVASNWCGEKVSFYKARSVFVPAGKTPEALYREWTATRPEYLERLELLQIDDVMTGEKRGLFKVFFMEHLPNYRHQLRFIEDANAGADLAVLGLGLNGHVAFHEPGIDNSFFSGCVRLNEITCDHLGLARGTWGISYGAAAFGASKAILMMVNGRSKREVLHRLLSGDPTLPASSLLKHPDFTILADREALPADSPFRAQGIYGGRKLESFKNV